MSTDLHQPEKVLIIKPSSLGDVITAIPILRGLKRTYPQSHVSWVVSNQCADILSGEKDLDEIILFKRRKLGRWYRSPLATLALLSFKKQLRSGGFDWVIDLQGLLRSAIFTKWTKSSVRIGFSDAREGAPLFYTHRIETRPGHVINRTVELGVKIGIDSRPEDMTLQPSESGESFFRSLCTEHSLDAGNYLVCVPPTRWETKTYPVRHWRKVVRNYADTKPVVLIGGPAENERNMCAAIADGMPGNVINLAGRTTIQDMVAVIKNASVVICGDSAAKFVSAAVSTPCVTLIGPTRVELTGPVGESRVVTAGTLCQGCLQKKCEHITCMQSIRPKLVCSEVAKILETESGTCRS